MTTDEQTEQLIGEATDWLLRLRAAPDNPVVRQAIADWIAAAPAHRDAWVQAEKAWRLIGAVPPTHAKQWRNPRQKRRRYIGLAAAAIAATLALIVAGTNPLTRWQADHVTATAEQRTVVLADGSRVYLGPRSALAIQDSPNQRGVRLLAGEAFFEVMPDPKRPFVVQADSVDVTVLGTAFDIRLDPAATTVDVKSGLVGVHRTAPLPSGAGPVDEKLSAGQRLTVSRDGGATRGAVNPEDVAVWRDGYLFVDGATIAQAVAEIRRYQPGWIYIADDRLAESRVTGLYDLRQPERAMRALVQPYGGQLRRVTPFLTVLSLPQSGS